MDDSASNTASPSWKRTPTPGVFEVLPNDQRPAIESSALAASISARARELGFVAVGFTGVGGLASAQEALSAWLGRQFEGQMAYLRTPRRSEPQDLLPGAQSAIVVAAAYHRPEARAQAPQLPIAAYALGEDYHQLIRLRLLELAGHCATLLGTPLRVRPCVDTAPLLERALASRAGVGFQGKSTLNIVPGVGSYILLGELLLDHALPETPAIAEGCGSCRLCLDACPSGAFIAPYVLDARRCISYLTIEHIGDIPRELRRAIGTRAFGCDRCQEVCPYNSSRKSPPPTPGLDARPELQQLDLERVLMMGASQYRRLVSHSALRRAPKRRLQRNAAVALGNSGRPEAVPALVRALNDNPDATVRGHAAWALGQLKTPEAMNALKTRRRHETHEGVLSEIALALEPCNG